MDSSDAKKRRRDQQFEAKLIRLQRDHLTLWFQFKALERSIRALPYPARKHASNVLSRLVRYSGHLRPRDTLERRLAVLEQRRERILAELKSLDLVKSNGRIST